MASRPPFGIDPRFFNPNNSDVTVRKPLPAPRSRQEAFTRAPKAPEYLKDNQANAQARYQSALKELLAKKAASNIANSNNPLAAFGWSVGDPTNTFGENFQDSIDRQGGWGIGEDTRKLLGADDTARDNSTVGNYLMNVKRPIQNFIANAADLAWRGVQGTMGGLDASLETLDQNIKDSGLATITDRIFGYKNSFQPGTGALSFMNAAPEGGLHMWGPHAPPMLPKIGDVRMWYGNANKAGIADDIVPVVDPATGTIVDSAPREDIAPVDAKTGSKRPFVYSNELPPKPANENIVPPEPIVPQEDVFGGELDTNRPPLSANDEALSGIDTEALPYNVETDNGGMQYGENGPTVYSQGTRKTAGMPEEYAEPVTPTEPANANGVPLTPQTYADRAAEEGLPFLNSPEAIEYYTQNAPAIREELDNRIQANTPEAPTRKPWETPEVTTNQVVEATYGKRGGKKPPEEPPAEEAANPPEEPVVGGEEPPPEGPSAIDKLGSALDKAEAALPDQAAARRAELSERLKEVGKARDTLSGVESLRSQKAALRGKLPTADASTFLENFTEKDLGDTLDAIKNNPNLRWFESIRASDGLTKLFNGDMPSPSEMALLRRALPQATVDKLVQHKDALKEAFSGANGQAEMFKPGDYLSTGPLKGEPLPEPKPVDPDKFIDNPKQGDFFKEKPGFNGKNGGGNRTPPPPSKLLQVLNVPKALRATLDLSIPFRQGAMFVGRPEFWKNFKNLYGTAFAKDSKGAYDHVMDIIHTDPEYGKMVDDMGIKFTEVDGPLSGREEDFMSDIPGKIPLFGRLHKRSEQGNYAFLNKLRFDMAKSFLKQYRDMGIEPDEAALKSIGNVVNIGTGRGPLPKSVAGAAPLANAAFFSPRLISGRIAMLNPYTYYKLDPVMRVQMAKEMLKMGAFGSSILMALKYGAGADVELDPRSSNFGKAVMGKVHLEPFGGLSSYLTFATRMFMNSTKSNLGEVKPMGGPGPYDQNRGTLTGKFVRSKLSPTAGAVTDLLLGKDFNGQPVTPSSIASNLLIPMISEDTVNAIKDQGPVKGTIAAIAGGHGFGLSVYDPMVPPAPASLKMAGVDVPLDANARKQWTNDVSSFISDSMEGVKKDGSWDKMDTDTQLAFKKEVIKEAKTQAKNRLFDMSSVPQIDPETGATRAPGSERVDPTQPLFDGFSGLPTSIKRTVKGNAKVGGVLNSDHLRGDAVDFLPPKGKSLDDLAEEARNYFPPNATILREGDHVHVRIPGLNGPLFGKKGTAQ